MESAVRDVLLSQVHESPLNPRRIFDPVKMEELVLSIKKHGVLEPLVVRKVGGRLELIAGARRFRAAALAHRKSVPVVVRQATDHEAFELMLVENLQRADLEPIDECEAYHHMVEKEGYTQLRIAEAIGKSGPYVNTRMKLRDLTAQARTALLEGRITVSHAIELARQPAKVQARALKVRNANQGPAQMTLHDLKSTIRPMEQRTKRDGTTYDVEPWQSEARA